MFVRLKVKLAEMVNGVDLSHCAEGDVIEVSDREAAMLIAEGWAEGAGDDANVTCHPVVVERDVAADRGVPHRGASTVSSWTEHRFPVTTPNSDKA